MTDDEIRASLARLVLVCGPEADIEDIATSSWYMPSAVCLADFLKIGAVTYDVRKTPCMVTVTQKGLDLIRGDPDD